MCTSCTSVLLYFVIYEVLCDVRIFALYSTEIFYCENVMGAMDRYGASISQYYRHLQHSNMTLIRKAIERRNQHSSRDDAIGISGLQAIIVVSIFRLEGFKVVLCHRRYVTELAKHQMRTWE
jgi:hypothetical protein